MSIISCVAKTCIAVLILRGIMVAPGAYADSPCGTFVIKITCYGKSGGRNSGYVFYDQFRDGTMIFNRIDEYYALIPKISQNQINFSKIKGGDTVNYHRVLAVHTSLLRDTVVFSGNAGPVDPEKLPITRHIHNFNYLDTVNYTYYNINSDFESSYRLDSMVDHQNHTIHYGLVEYLDLDTISLVVLDTILWCGDSDQLQFLNRDQIQRLTSGSTQTYFRLADSYAQQWWIDFFCLEPSWTQRRILSLLDLEGIDRAFLERGGDTVFEEFPPELQRAVTTNQVIYFLRWSP